MRAGAVILARVLVPQPGQAQGPLIHPTPPLVPTGRRGAPIPRLDRQNSLGEPRDERDKSTLYNVVTRASSPFQATDTPVTGKAHIDQYILCLGKYPGDYLTI